MSAERIVRHTLASLRKVKGKTDWARVDALTDEDIEQAVAADPDAAPILDEEWFRNARRIEPENKIPVSMRFDPEVVEWFKTHTEHYQSSMNAVLKSYVHHQTETRANLAEPLRKRARKQVRHRRKSK
jgi:uncharacterized protein (DUF4415 family)